MPQSPRIEGTLTQQGDVTIALGQAHPASGSEEVKYVPVAPALAETLNAALPNTDQPKGLAKAFPSAAISGVSRQTAIDCLTSAIYYEAASESAQGQRAVAQVVLNRVRHPAFAKSVCGVVYQGSERKTGCQFSFTCDGSLSRMPMQSVWNRVRKIAEMALAGYVEPSVGLATHYHTVWVVPYWRDSLVKIDTLGAHIFYRWSGSWGRSSAFSSRYAGIEAKPTRNTELSTELAVTGLEEFAIPADALSPTTVDGVLQQSAAPALAEKTPLPETVAPVADRHSQGLLADERSGVLVLNNAPRPRGGKAGTP